MTHLIPVQRMDKNGKLVTRHVRPSTDSGAKNTLPAPSVTTPANVSGLDALREFKMSRFVHESSTLIHPRSNMGKMNFEFIACDYDVYDVMSVTSNGNAFVLLEMGIRSPEEAVDYLREHDADILIEDNSELVQEMIQRGIPADKFARAYEDISPSMKHMSKYLADGIEFSTAEAMMATSNVSVVTNDIMDGRIKLSDLKAVGYERLDGRLFHMREPLMRHAAEEATFTLDELRWFLDQPDVLTMNGPQTAEAMSLFEYLGAKKMKKLGDISTLVHSYRAELPQNAAERREEMDRAFYQAQLLEGLADAPSHRSSRYWATDLRRDVDQLRQSDIKVEDALPLMREGRSAQEAIGIIAGIETSIAGGWL